MDNCCVYLILVGYLCLSVASVSSFENKGMECHGIEEPNKYILCYANSSISLPTHVDVCRCSHLVVPLAVNTISNASITLDQELVAFLKASGSRNGGRLRRVLSLTVSTEDFSTISSVQSIANSIAGMIDDLLIEGVEIYWQRSTIDENSKKDKANLVLFMKELHAVLQEKIIVTSSPSAIGDRNRTSAGDIGEIDATRPLIFLRLPTAPEYLVKAYDLKPLARTVDLFVIATHEMADANNVTYHHSRLMGLSDILNTDSVMDLVASLGVSSDRVVAAVPTFAVQFRLTDVYQNLPGSPVVEAPFRISKEQLCAMLSKGNWTVERDDDLTGTYAYSDEGDWIAFDDEIAAQIKAKYFLLRDVAGVAIVPATMNDKLTRGCNPDIAEPSIVQIYYDQFHYQESGERTRRQLAKSLQEDVSSVATALSSPIYNERVRASSYRIVRIVSRSGETSVIRQPLESSLQCSRQGYYRHPEDCGRFYRCVKFDQYIDDFTVFEYDCPEGLVFDDRYEVCTWPSQAAPCGGSSEIRPVPMNKFVCPGEGYFADPENCRWFFACRDYAKDGSPFTQYEFRCPFGLLFDEQNLICNWPWLVPQCSGASSSNIDIIKSKTQLEKKEPNPIAIGSPGYLSGKLVTGEGLYTDPRPVQYKEAVISTGCIGCQSAGLVVQDPSQDDYPESPTAKQTKLVLAIPAATVADQSTPVRIIVASPASSSQQYTTSKTPEFYAQKYLSTTTAQYQTPYGLSWHGPSGSAGSPAIQQTYESSSSSKLSAPSVISVPKLSGSLGNGKLSGYPHGRTPISLTENVELKVHSGKGESDIYHSGTRSKDDALLSSYSDPSSNYGTPVGVSSLHRLHNHQVTLGNSGGNVKDVPTNSPSASSKNGIAGDSSYQGKHGVLELDASPVYPSGQRSESAQGRHDRYPDVPADGYIGSIKTEGSVVSNQAAAYEAPAGNSQYSEYQKGAAAHQAPTTEASVVPHTHLQSQYKASAMDQKKPYSAQQVPVSSEKVSESFSEAPATVTKTLVEDYRDNVSYSRTSVPTYPPVYRAAIPVYTTPIPIYQSTASANEASAPAYETSAPVYKASAPTYKAAAPAFKAPTAVYQAPSIVYKNPVPSYEAPAPVYQAPDPVYQAPAPVYQAPAPVYQALVHVYQAPPSVYQTPAIVYNNPAATYEGPAAVYKTPSLAYEAPAAIYKNPAPAHEASAPASSYEASAPVFKASAAMYKAPASAYETPAPVYQGPTPVYRTSTSTYQAPATFYEVKAPAFQAPLFAHTVSTSVYKATVPDDEASIRIHETSTTKEQLSSSVYVASTPMSHGQTYETVNSSYKALVSGHNTMASIHQASFLIYEESSDASKSSTMVDNISSRVHEGHTSVYDAPLAGIEIFTSPINGESAAINEATPSSYEARIPNYETDSRPVNDVISASIYEDPIPVAGSSDPYTYGSVTIRPSGSSAYGFQQTDAKSENIYPYVHTGETADRQKISYSANSPSKNHGSWNDGKQSSPPIPTNVYDKATEKQSVSGGDSRSETGKTNEATMIRTSSSHTYNAESGNTPQFNQDYEIRKGKDVTRAGISSYSSGLAPSVQFKNRERSQVPKEMDSDMADLFHRGSTGERTMKAPRERLNSSPSSVMQEVKQAAKGNLEISRVSGSRRTGGSGEMRGTSGAGGVGGSRRTGGVDETRRAGIGSRTQDFGGLRKVGVARDKGNGGAIAVSATGYTETDHSLAEDGPNGEAHGKRSQNIYSSTFRNQDDYETPGLFGDNTFGLKEEVKTKNKYNAARLVVSDSSASESTNTDTNTYRRTSNGKISYGGSRIGNGNGDSVSKQQDVSTAISQAGYKGSERVHTELGQAQLTLGTDFRTYQSNPDATILPPASSYYHDKFSHLPNNDEAITPYGDKQVRVTVKVPSTNKAAILEKWAFTSSSAMNTKPDSREAKRPASVDGSSLNATPAQSQSSTKHVTSNDRQPIKNRITVKPKNQDMTPDTVQFSVELSASDAVPLSSGTKSSDNGLGKLNGTEYGNRYLEKITVAQATARNETLGSEVCVRAGLFRHPYDCQKFYECYWDRWIHQYTVHIFKCPVHLVYDDYITACNWPLDGPACVPHEAVKLYPQLPSSD